jgi:hypothetical protein
VKRLALVAALGGCSAMGNVIAKHPIMYDVIDGALIVGASSVAIADHDDAVQGTAIGVDVLALAMIPLLVVCTVFAGWRPN